MELGKLWWTFESYFMKNVCIIFFLIRPSRKMSFLVGFFSFFYIVFTILWVHLSASRGEECWSKNGVWMTLSFSTWHVQRSPCGLMMEKCMITISCTLQHHNMNSVWASHEKIGDKMMDQFHLKISIVLD